MLYPTYFDWSLPIITITVFVLRCAANKHFCALLAITELKNYIFPFLVATCSVFVAYSVPINFHL